MPAHARLTANGYLSAVAATLDLRKPRLLKEFGLGTVSQHQSVGSISESGGVRVSQTAASASVDLPVSVTVEDVPGVVRGFATGHDNFLLLILDQAEQLILGDKSNALEMFDALARSALRGRVGVVIVVREDFISDIMPLAGAHPTVLKQIVRVPGFSVGEAEELVRKGNERSEVRFTNGSIRHLLERMIGSNRQIWPIALHAVCRQITSRALRTGRRVSARDLDRLGDVKEALSHAIAEVLAVLSPADRSEAIFLLHTISRVSRQTGTPAIEDLKRALPNYPEDMLARIIDALTGLHLLERRPGGRLALAHDVVGSAIHLLLAKKADEIELAVDAWGMQNRTQRDTLNEEEINGILKERVLPIAHIIFLAEVTFAQPARGSASIELRLRAHLRSKPSRDVAEFVRKRSAHLSREGNFRPEHFFVLLLDDRSDTIATAVTAITRQSTDQDFDLIGLEDAIRMARPCGFTDVLSDNDHYIGALPQCCLRIIVEYFTRNQVVINSILAERIWEAAETTTRPAALSLLSACAPEMARKCAMDCCGHPSPLVRAAAFEVLFRLHDRPEDYLEVGLVDVSPIVRRRIAVSLARSDRADLGRYLGRLANDRSPLVREAVIEGIGTTRRSDLAAFVVAALDDDCDFVRESAVYALKDVLDPLAACRLARLRLRDEAAKVGEAAYNLLTIAGLPIASTSLISDLHHGDPAVAIAAIEASADAMSADIDAALIELLRNGRTPAPVATAAMSAAGKYLPREAAEAANRFLFSEDLDLVMASILAIQRFARPDAAAMLVKLVTHASVDVRERVVYALAELGGVEAAAGLRRALFDTSTGIVARAIYGLARLNDRGAADLVSDIPPLSAEVTRAKRYFGRA